MRTHWTSGAIALGAIAVATESFALVDATMGESASCADGLGCLAPGLPTLVVLFAVIGTIAGIAAIAPGIGWIVTAANTRTERGGRGDTDGESELVAANAASSGSDDGR